MNKKEILDHLIDKHDGVLVTGDAVEAGISKTYFSHETALYLIGLAEREPLQFTLTALTM